MSKNRSVQAQAGQKIRTTLVYMDIPASPAAAKALVNDLDLKIQSPSGKIFYPNHGSAPDRLNNTEMVESDISESGNYSITVYAENVVSVSRRQSFALIYSVE